MNLEGIDTLINLSGGYDSTYVLWQWLKNNPDKRILVHHCYLQSNQNRLEVETKAIDDILNWLREDGLDNFEVFTTKFEFVSKGKSYDYNVIAFINALMFRLEEFKDIKTLLVCLNAGDTNATPFPDTMKHYKSVKDDPGFPGADDRKIKIEFPIRHIDKKEVEGLIPEDLRKLCWSCATPRYDKKLKRLVPCHRCQSCFGMQ